MQFEEKEAVKVATMYYEEGLTQAAIAKKMGVSRSLISKILLDAKEDGVIEVFIHSKSAYTVQLERKLEKKYNLKNAVVVDTFNLVEDEVSKVASQEAALYLQKISNSIKTIGISWGKSIRGLVDYYPYTNQPNTTIIPLIGGMGDDYVDIHSNQLAYDLARKMRGKSKYLYTPALVSTSSIKKELRNNKANASVLEAGKNVELAIVGIANPFSANTMLEIGYIDEKDVEDLQKCGAIGDINSRFFNRIGEEVECVINKHVIGLSLQELEQIPIVMTIAYKQNKTEAIKVALNEKLINVLVTSDVVAEKILEE